MDTYLYKILIVHHQPEIRERLAQDLRAMGYLVSVATNGLDGMFAGYYETFALIISGMKLPKVSGFEMMRAIQNRYYNRITPAIFIGTGEENHEAVALASKLKAVIIPLSAITSSINKVDESFQFNDLLSFVKLDRPKQ